MVRLAFPMGSGDLNQGFYVWAASPLLTSYFPSPLLNTLMIYSNSNVNTNGLCRYGCILHILLRVSVYRCGSWCYHILYFSIIVT